MHTVYSLGQQARFQIFFNSKGNATSIESANKPSLQYRYMYILHVLILPCEKCPRIDACPYTCTCQVNNYMYIPHLNTVASWYMYV